MSDNVFKLPVKEQWLFSVDVFRRPDGTLIARLSDARKSEIERYGSTSSCLCAMADQLRGAADNMAEDAANFEDIDQ